MTLCATSPTIRRSSPLLFALRCWRQKTMWMMNRVLKTSLNTYTLLPRSSRFLPLHPSSIIYNFIMINFINMSVYHSVECTNWNTNLVIVLFFKWVPSISSGVHNMRNQWKHKAAVAEWFYSFRFLDSPSRTCRLLELFWKINKSTQISVSWQIKSFPLQKMHSCLIQDNLKTNELEWK